MPVTIYYLQLLPTDLVTAAPRPEQAISLVECQADAWEINRFFYHYVGQHWQWMDKKEWEDRQWQEYVESPQLRTWMLLFEGTPVGYFELFRHSDASVEIAYFGLAKAFLGRGLGGWLLSEALSIAQQWSDNRVWVHTCNLDHPAALKNYQARGMQLYKTEVESATSA